MKIRTSFAVGGSPAHLETQEVVYQNRYQYTCRVTTRARNGTREYFVTDYGHRAGVIAVRHGCVLLVRQYRLFLNGLSWELPGGRVEDGETPDAAAVRECFEETGIRCTDLKPLITFQQGLDTVFNPTHLFHTVSIDESASRPQNSEAEELSWVPLDGCLEMLAAGQIVDAISMLGLLAYRTMTQRSAS